jgi:hypothetical protein
MKVSKKAATVILPLASGIMLASFSIMGLGVLTAFGIFAYQVYVYLDQGTWEWLTVADFGRSGAPIVGLMGTWPAIVPVLVFCGAIYAFGLSISERLERLLPDNGLECSSWPTWLFLYVLPAAAIVALFQASRYFLSGE